MSRPASGRAAGARDPKHTRRLLVDATRTLDSGLHTGIQRVVRGLWQGAQTVATQQTGLSVHAVRCEGSRWLDVGGLPPHPLEVRGERPTLLRTVCAPLALRPQSGDVLLLADASWYVDPWPAVAAWRDAGGEVAGFVHDLLPLLQPGWFRPGTSALFERHFRRLLASADQLLVASEHVATQLRARAEVTQPIRVLPLASSLQGTAAATRAAAPGAGPPFFLCVATLEPRKNHAVILDAFETLWRRGSGAELTFVGSAGWCNDALLDRLGRHPELDRRLHWLRDIDDRQLVTLYQRAAALIYVPDDEGFGIPVLEARQLGCPVIASDIPPLREAGGDWPWFLPPGDAGSLLAAIQRTLRTERPGAQYTGRHWQDVAREMLASLGVERNPALAMTGTDA